MPSLMHLVCAAASASIPQTHPASTQLIRVGSPTTRSIQSFQADLSAAASSLPRLLLFTEKAEEVFMLGQGLPQAQERGQLARAVMEDRGNPAVWWRLLQHVGRVFWEPDRCDAKHAYVLWMD